MENQDAVDSIERTKSCLIMDESTQIELFVVRNRRARIKRLVTITLRERGPQRFAKRYLQLLCHAIYNLEVHIRWRMHWPPCLIGIMTLATMHHERSPKTLG